MASVTVRFREMVQNVQNLAVEGEGDSMLSEVHFDLVTPEGVFTGLRALVKQAAGSNFETDPLEVGPVEPGIELDRWNHAGFGACVERYFRSLVGSTGSGIHIAGGSNIVMQNNLFRMPSECAFDLPEN